MAQRLLVVVAHPDDETFGCGSLLAHAASRGATVTVVCATRGEAGQVRPGTVLDADLGTVREAELRAAAELLGVSEVLVLDWADSGMDGEPDPTSLMAAPVDDVAAVLTGIVDRVQPDVVVTLDASDGHRDHAHVRDATLAAVAAARWRTPRTFLHCLPRPLMRQWMAELERSQPDSDHLGLADLGTPEDRFTTVLDTTEHLELRDAAIALHASQVSPFEVMPAALRRAFLAAEHLQQVDPPWPGGEPATELFDDPGPGQAVRPRR